MLAFLLNLFRAPTPEVDSIWLCRTTGSRYVVREIGWRRRVWFAMESKGIVQQPKEVLGRRAFHLCFIRAAG